MKKQTQVTLSFRVDREFQQMLKAIAAAEKRTGKAMFELWLKQSFADIKEQDKCQS